jgi:hypothetical protein
MSANLQTGHQPYSHVLTVIALTGRVVAATSVSLAF